MALRLESQPSSKLTIVLLVNAKVGRLYHGNMAHLLLNDFDIKYRHGYHQMTSVNQVT